MLKTRDVFNCLLKLSFISLISIFLFSAILFSQDSSFKNNLYLLEKDYLTQKSLFESYLLDFPIINFSINDNNSEEEYLKIIEDYSSLPKLQVSSFHDSNKVILLDLNKYNLDYNSSKIIKKYKFLKVNFNDNSFNEYIFIEVLLLDENIYFLDLIKENDILNKNNLIKTKEIDSIEYLLYDENISYLIDLNNRYYDLKPVQLLDKITIIQSPEIVIEKEPNYVLSFFITIFCLLLCYSLFYYKEGKLFLNLINYLKKEIINYYNYLKKEIKKILKKI
jgi:hypothetical protein